MPDNIYDTSNDPVAKRVTGLLSKDNPLMMQAKTRGMQYANKRGLLNSTMGGQAAQSAMIDAAMPIASQDSDIESREKLGFANIAAHDREKATSAMAAAQNTYNEGYRTVTTQGEFIPAATREKYLTHLGAMRDQNLNLLEQLYDVDLDWASVDGGGEPATA